MAAKKNVQEQQYYRRVSQQSPYVPTQPTRLQRLHRSSMPDSISQQPLYQLERRMSDNASYAYDGGGQHQQQLKYEQFMLPSMYSLSYSQMSSMFMDGNASNSNNQAPNVLPPKNQMYGITGGRSAMKDKQVDLLDGYQGQQYTNLQRQLSRQSYNTTNYNNVYLNQNNYSYNEKSTGPVCSDMLPVQGGSRPLITTLPHAPMYSKALMKRLSNSTDSTYGYNEDQKKIPDVNSEVDSVERQQNNNSYLTKHLQGFTGEHLLTSQDFTGEHLLTSQDFTGEHLLTSQDLTSEQLVGLNKMNRQPLSNKVEPNSCQSYDQQPFLGSAEDLDIMAKNLMEEVDCLSFDSFQDFLGSPLVELKSGINHSPMSVESNKTDSSSGSMKDLRNLKSLSLVVSTTATDPGFFMSLQQGSKVNKSKTSSARVTTNEAVISNPQEPNHTSLCMALNNSCSTEEKNSKVLSPIGRTHHEKYLTPPKEIIPQNVSPFENDIDSVFRNDNTVSFMNLLKEINEPYPSRPHFLQRSLSTPGLDVEKNNSSKNMRRSRKCDSDSLLKMARVTPMKSSKSDNFNKEKNMTSQSAFCLPTIDGKSDCASDHVTDVSVSESSLTESDKMKKTKGLYFENKSFFKIRQNLRELASLRTETARRFPPDKLTQKCSKLFLNQLVNMKTDNWVLESVEPAVKNDRNINLKNFTERKIKIYKDISQEHIYEYVEPSGAQPFQYFSDDANKKHQPSETLMNMLTDRKFLSPVKKDNLEEIKVL